MDSQAGGGAVGVPSGRVEHVLTYPQQLKPLVRMIKMWLKDRHRIRIILETLDD